MIDKIVSGGRTGADRAGLDASLDAGNQVGGYCPKGRLSGGAVGSDQGNRLRSHDQNPKIPQICPLEASFYRQKRTNKAGRLKFHQ